MTDRRGVLLHKYLRDILHAAEGRITALELSLPLPASVRSELFYLASFAVDLSVFSATSGNTTEKNAILDAFYESLESIETPENLQVLRERQLAYTRELKRPEQRSANKALAVRLSRLYVSLCGLPDDSPLALIASQVFHELCVATFDVIKGDPEALSVKTDSWTQLDSLLRDPDVTRAALREVLKDDWDPCETTDGDTADPTPLQEHSFKTLVGRVEVHFHTQKEASLILETNCSGHEEMEVELQLFASFALRLMMNLGPHPVTASLGTLLSVIDDGALAALRYGGEGPTLAVYPGSPGRKRFEAQVQLLNHTADTKFQAKGFGLLARGVGYYGPTSVIALLKYLAQRRPDNPTWQTTLRDVARACGFAVMANSVTLLNQHVMARQIVRAAMAKLRGEQGDWASR